MDSGFRIVSQTFAFNTSKWFYFFCDKYFRYLLKQFVKKVYFIDLISSNKFYLYVFVSVQEYYNIYNIITFFIQNILRVNSEFRIISQTFVFNTSKWFYFFCDKYYRYLLKQFVKKVFFIDLISFNKVYLYVFISVHSRIL